jgi:acyl-coenzyme A thioesterase PaaI-like protein
VELKLNVFAAAGTGDELLATAEHLHAGRSTHVVQVRVANGDRPAAHLLLTQFILRPG